MRERKAADRLKRPDRGSTGSNNPLVKGSGVRIVEGVSSPFPIDAMVREEDTYLVLSADPEFRPSTEHPIRLFEELSNVEPVEPGAVVVRSGDPLEFLAVVHDLGRDPTWKRGWIEEALDAIFDEVRARSIRSLGMPILGTVHGTLAEKDGRRLLMTALRTHRGCGLRRLWLKSG
jgi:hypothetical protein